METRKLKGFLTLLILTGFIAYSGMGMVPPGEARAPTTVNALLLVDDLYGASLNIEDNQNNILENFAEYGWNVSIASCTPEVNPCPWASLQGCDVLQPDIMTYQLDDAAEWDVIVIIPGGTHQHLVDCPFVLSILAQARINNIPIAAWCRGVRVLAAADVINEVEITGHPDYTDEYLAAGAYYLGSAQPPTEDQAIITCVDATENRQEMCEMIRDIVESTTSVKEKKRKSERIEVALCPNPIRSSSCIEFELHERSVVHIALFNQQGNMVQDIVKQEFLPGKNKVTFSPSALPTGIYYVYVFCDGRMGMRKCMII